MKIFITLIALISVFLAGCVAPLAPEEIDIQTTTPDINRENTAFIGDVFFESVACYGRPNSVGNSWVSGDCLKYDLTVIGLSGTTIKLEYREYMKKTSIYGTYNINSSWLVKDGFTRVFEYSAKQNKISYKSKIFNLISLNENSITYIRIN